MRLADKLEEIVEEIVQHIHTTRGGYAVPEPDFQELRRLIGTHDAYRRHVAETRAFNGLGA